MKSDGCWTWNGSHNVVGRATFLWKGKVEPAARVMIEITKNVTLMKGQVACHTCDNPGCMNPLHLFVGTQKENMHDSCRKGRRPCKIKPWDVQTVRDRYNAGESPKSIALTYGVGAHTVVRVLNGVTWGYLQLTESFVIEGG